MKQKNYCIQNMAFCQSMSPFLAFFSNAFFLPHFKQVTKHYIFLFRIHLFYYNIADISFVLVFISLYQVSTPSVK